MSSSLPLRSQTKASADMLRMVQDAMLGFLTALSRMPHVQPDSLKLPPPEGGSGIDVDTLKARGKTDEAIDFLRHLPYLVHGSNITFDSSKLA